MFENSTMTIEVGNREIKILYGSKKKIRHFGIIKTPEESFQDDQVVNVQRIAKAVEEHLKKNGIRSRKVCFSIQGQDIVIRHMETPVMDRKGIMRQLQWEVSQYLPDGGENYYYDYEITEKIMTKEKKVLKLMVVSVPKSKIEPYIELARKLGLNLLAVDIAPNNVARVFKTVHKFKKEINSVGVIHMGVESSTFTVLDKGKLFIEREVPFGLSNMLREVLPEGRFASDEDMHLLTRKLNLYKSDESETSQRVKSRFDNVLSTFNMVIQFYTSGRAEKTLDRLYIIGEGSDISGIDSYVQDYFSTTTEIADNPKNIGIDLKLPRNCKFTNCVTGMGMLLRKE